MGGDRRAVKRWTKKAKVDIFTKKYIVIPVHLQVHWCLGVSSTQLFTLSLIELFVVVVNEPHRFF